MWTIAKQTACEKGDSGALMSCSSKFSSCWAVLWPPHAKSWFIGKDSDAGRYREQEEKVTTKDEMAGWHHRLDAHKFRWTPGFGDGQGGLACCYSCGRRKSDTTERLTWTYTITYCELAWYKNHTWTVVKQKLVLAFAPLKFNSKILIYGHRILAD